MSKAQWLFFALLLLLSSTGSSSIAQLNPGKHSLFLIQNNPSAPGGRQNRYAEGRVIIKFREDATTEDIDTVKRELRLEIIHTFSSPNLYLMRICDNTPVQTVLERLKGYPGVKYAEPDAIYKID